ncbi:SDR family NAD(P)-dependent oxidoreductase [Paenibacillus sp. FSL H7-0331]|uniref:SDR family NAD(P)-dependent oxidoreductase n=1 Tax=Paenibacillus sp. FSL H7-0331 TaxID=1920421 RepID=UPI00096C5479|nr:SDR family oxidoreductase [Paenibacillus sp. FSL H7-0331]OMF11618.1 short-chain dehydrogenase [Paenibacillus sp. FSL H7-0331]
MNLQGKVAIVTGGARGIGRAVSILLSSRGAKVVVNYLSNMDAAEEVVSHIRANNGEAIALQADVREPDQVLKLVAAAKKSLGRIDILVSNANMSFQAKPFAEMSWEAFSQKLNDELKAAFQMTKAVIPFMIEKQFGRIIYISSTLGKDPSHHMIAHGTAKGALDTFSTYIAQEFGPQGIHANVVAPGLVQTDATAYLSEQEKMMISNFTPLGRVAEPEDIAGVIAFLASDDARFMTGTYTPVAGGLSMG